jgi:hypothetical protein
MSEHRESVTATARTARVWGGVLLLVVAAGFLANDPVLRRQGLRATLLLIAAGEGLAGLMQVFRVQRMSEWGGRPYDAAYHGLVQDFGFYNLALAMLFAFGGVEPEANAVVLPVAIALYALPGGTHVLRYFGVYYGGETSIPSRPRHLELRDGLPLIVAVVAMVLFSLPPRHAIRGPW